MLPSNEVILALLIKKVEDRLSEIPEASALRGSRGPQGPAGKDFDIRDHRESFINWAKEFALKFDDFTEEQLELIKGQKGKDGKDGVKGKDGRDGAPGKDGKDGKDFSLEENKVLFEQLAKKFALKFDDFTEEQISSLKGSFSDLTEEEVSSLRGPRGQRGKQGEKGERGYDGKDGVGRDGIDGADGMRGLPGVAGKDGIDGKNGMRGPVGSPGIRGANGRDGIDGQDGEDAPFVTNIALDQVKDEIEFAFEFSDGSEIKTNSVKLPKSGSSFSAGGGGAGGGGPSSLVESGSWASPNVITDEISFLGIPLLRKFVVGDAGPVSATVADGNALQVVHLVGTSDTDTVSLSDDTNLKLSGPIVLREASYLVLSWISGLSKWVEVSRNEI